jgi:hypothetical protein
LTKRVVSFLKEVDEKEAEKKDASCSKKKETTKDMVARWTDGAKGASRMSGLRGSSAPMVLKGLSLQA